MSSSASPRVPRILGHYEILSALGKGGMAEVFRARVLSGPRQGWVVALKRLLPSLVQDPASLALFDAEARLTQLLNHPNIVQVLDVGSVADQHFMVMELVDGRDLGHILRRCKQRGIYLPLDFALYLCRVLLDALSYAHSLPGPNGGPLGLFHCDVSPSNLFISRLGDIKLGDFGVARLRVDGVLQGGEVLGKPYYLSPEALQGELSPQVDLWAACVVLYELLTLQRPFVGATPEEVFKKIIYRDYVAPSLIRPEIPEPLEEIIARGFSITPAERFTSAEDFAAALTPHYDEWVGTPLAIAAVVRGLFGITDAK
ncbi:Serine/threonine protein kinase PrkC, regulator of stationary phase [Cystobacter fuscus DSM 2262]|uniref:Serine/threonine protein kinase PrkC, regulator of stationary phase n=1 Tax=Cystobacter fuscus (strain ATCC 25194 / DSM 2262 / NBRC 100088 / M29) TaxID=1242864 RepID=S9NZQ9_CYSF2|nr:serine/threonine-protein kinase [Cystobacter fuscus]EPX55507.1 Serine/threonine protein kinase PrkC, regulator of stationary phase [Cystobacter fuscus DSM 2262]